MRLRQLCETEDVPVKEVPNLISAENHVSGNRNTISDLVNETAVSGQAVNKADDERSQHPKSKSQQPQKNAVDKGKNIMDNRNASTKHPISNNYKEGKMHGSDQDTKSIEERLLGAIESIDVNQVKCLVEKDTNVTESILSEALKKANERIINLKKDSKKKNHKDRLIQIIKLLEEKLKSIGGAAPSVDDSAATGSQATHAAELKESEEDQPDSPSSKSSVGGSNDSASSFVRLPESDTENSNGEYVKVPSGSGSGSSFEEVGEDENVSTSKSSSPQDTQPGISTSKPSGISVEGGTAVPSVDGNKEKQTSPTGNAAQMDDYGLSLPFPEDDNKNSQPVPLVPAPTPEPMLPLTSKKSEQVNNTTPQNTKGSNLHIIAAPALAIVGAALGVAIAVHLEMLAVGIAVGACCLVAAAVMYHYKWPSSFIETNKVEKVAPNEKKEPVATSV